MEKFEVIKKAFETDRDEKNAVAMSKYMRDLFEFYGLATPRRKAVYKSLIKNEKQSKKIDWDFLDKCYEARHREFQYLVCDYLIALKQYAAFEDISKIEKYITTKSWWDTVDFLCKVIGDIGLRDARVKGLMLDWSQHENIWLKRAAIEHQLSSKEETDTELLAQIIVNCLGSNEFFINKAIGWALREYSKTNSQWVREFIEKHREKMCSLSIKEASKYI